MVNSGASAEATDEERLTPLHDATRVCNKGFANAKDFKQLPRIIQILLQTNPEIDIRDNKGRTPLHYAAGIEVSETQCRDRKLCIAIMEAHADIVKTLLNHGADADARDNSNATPLHRMLQKKRFTFSSLNQLLKNGADVNARDR